MFRGILAAHWPGRALLSALGLLLASPAHAEPRLELVAPGLTCPSPEQLRGALAEALQGWQVAEGPEPATGASLRVEPSGPGQVRLEFRVAERPAQRKVLSVEAGRCGDAARTIALVTRLWVRRLPAYLEPGAPHRRRAPEPAPEVSRAEPRPSEPPPAPAPSPEARGVRLSGAVAEPAPAQTLTGAVSAPASPPIQAAPTLTPAPVVRLSPPEASGPTPKAGLPVHLEARLGGSLFASTAGNLTGAAGSLGLDVGLGERFGAVLEGQLDTPLEGRLGPGVVTVQRATLGLDGRLNVLPREGGPNRLRLQVGPALQRLQAQALGYTQGGSAVDWVPGLGASVCWERLLVGGLSTGFGVSALGWVRQDSFSVENLGVALLLPQFWVGGTLGLGWRFL